MQVALRRGVIEGKSRKEVAEISLEQFRTLSSPVRADIVAAYMPAGPSSVADIARLTGRRPTAVHYHVAELLKVGLIQQVATRQAGKRYEAVYDVPAQKFTRKSRPSKEYISEQKRAVRIMLRNMARNYERVLTTNPASDSYFETLNVCLNDAQRAVLFEKLDALIKEAKEHQDPDGTRLTMLSIAIPITASGGSK